MAEAVVTALVTSAISAGINYLLAPDGPDIEGPRLQDRGVQRNSYGTPLSLIYGTMICSGSLIWLLNNELTETKKTESQGGKGGGGGGSVTTYSYAFTGINAVCDGPINGIQRIWADTTLIYDVDASDKSDLFGASVYDFESALGTSGQSQGVDHSGEHGAANTPAYRGTALHFIDDMQLADYGNRIPNFQYEVAGRFSYDLESGTTDLSIEKVGDLIIDYSAGDPTVESDWYNGVGMRSDGAVLRVAQPLPNVSGIGGQEYVGTYSTQTGLLVPPNQVLVPSTNVSGLFSEYAAGGYAVERAAFTCNGSAYCLLQFGFGNRHAWYHWPTQQPLHGPLDTSAYASRVGGAFGPLRGRSIHTSQQLAETQNYLWSVDYIGVGEPLYLCCYSKTSGDPHPARIWKLTEYLSGAVDEPQNVQLDGDPTQSIVVVWDRAGTSLPRRGYIFSESLLLGGSPEFITINAGSATPYQMKYNPRRNWVLSANDTHIFLYDSITGDEIVYQSLSSIGSVANATRKFSIWWVSPTAFTDGYSVYQFVKDPTLDADADDSQSGADLQEVVEDLCFRSGLSTSEVDASDLAGTAVRGYKVSQVQSLRESLEPLMLAYQFEPYEEDYTLKFRFKDRSSTLTITEDDLRPHLFDGEYGEYVEVEQVEETKLPLRVNVNYYNFNADYEPDTQFAERSVDATTSKHVSEVTLEMSQTPTFAVQLADKLLREAWTSRTSYTFSLPKKYAYLTPSDIVTLNLEDYTVDVRLQDVAMGVDGRVQCRAIAHAAAVYTSARTTDEPINTGDGYPKILNAPLWYYVIDTNSLLFATGTPDGYFPLYHAGWSSHWKGYQLQSSTDGTTWASVGDPQLNKATIGYVTSPIGDRNPHFQHSFDPLDEVTVYFFDENPDLSSVTDLEVQGGQNIFAVGAEGRWEILGAATITQNDSHSHTLSRLLRGLRGTEGNCATMQVGDAVILLTPDTIGMLPVSTDRLGTTMQYRAVYGTTFPSEDDTKSISQEGNPLKEFAPAQLRAVENTSGDLVITWARRTRLSGEWRDTVDAFLAVNSKPEAYKVEIYDDTASPQLLRTIETSESSATYTSAQRSSDSSTLPSAIRIRVYQISSDVQGYYEEIEY
jgi:hypothetical protein